MIKLIRFKNIQNDDLYINPALVTAVSTYPVNGPDCAMVYFTAGAEDYLAVKGTPEDVAARLQA